MVTIVRLAASWFVKRQGSMTACYEETLDTSMLLASNHNVLYANRTPFEVTDITYVLHR